MRRTIRIFDHIQSENGKNFLQFRNQFAGQNIVAAEHRTGPVSLVVAVNALQQFTELGNIFRRIADQNGIGTVQFNAGSPRRDKLAELIHRLSCGGSRERIEKNITLSIHSRTDIRLLTDLGTVHDPQQRILHFDGSACERDHVFKRRPEFPTGHLAVQVERNSALDIAVCNKIESQHIGKGRKYIQKRRTVENQRNGNFLISIEQNKILIKRLLSGLHSGFFCTGRCCCGLGCNNSASGKRIKLSQSCRIRL